MALNNTNNFLQSLIDAGADAQTNLYAVTFTGGELTNVDEQLSVRCQGFQPPEISQDTYSVRYVSAQIDRPVAKVNITRNFTLTFRVDANYDVYKALLNQMRVTSNPSKSYTATDILSLYNDGELFDTVVKTVNEGITEEDTYDNMTLYAFRGCWISNISTPNYSTDNAGAATCTVNIRFLTMEDRQSGITGETASPNVVVGQ